MYDSKCMHILVYYLSLLLFGVFLYFHCLPRIASQVIISTSSCITYHFFEKYFRLYISTYSLVVIIFECSYNTGLYHMITSINHLTSSPGNGFVKNLPTSIMWDNILSIRVCLRPLLLSNRLHLEQPYTIILCWLKTLPN